MREGVRCPPGDPAAAAAPQDFLPTFAAELAVWPLFQTFNFTRIPVEHQLLAVNGMTLVVGDISVALICACCSAQHGLGTPAGLAWARNRGRWLDKSGPRNVA